MVHSFERIGSRDYTWLWVIILGCPFLEFHDYLKADATSGHSRTESGSRILPTYSQIYKSIIESRLKDHFCIHSR